MGPPLPMLSFFCVVAVETLMCLYFMRPGCVIFQITTPIFHKAESQKKRKRWYFNIRWAQFCEWKKKKHDCVRGRFDAMHIRGRRENSLNYWALREGKKLSSRGGKVHSRVVPAKEWFASLYAAVNMLRHLQSFADSLIYYAKSLTDNFFHVSLKKIKFVLDNIKYLTNFCISKITII